jgi:hypothetical protein
VTHDGKRPGAPRFSKILAAERAAGCNEIEAYRRFVRDMVQKKEESLEFLNSQRDEGKQVFGLGAPVKGNTLLNYFGIGPELIECLVEKNPLRKGLVSPGMHIPVVLEDEINPPDTYYVLAWNFREEILRNNRDLIETGVTFYFPVETRIDESLHHWSDRLSRAKSYPCSENEWASGDRSGLPGLQPAAG